MSNRSKGAPLSEAERARLRSLLERVGERAAAASIGVERRTLARCLAGLPLYPGTRALVALKLAEIAAEAA